MKKYLSYFLYTLLLASVVCACSSDVDIYQAYTFELVTMPVPKKIAEGETVEIRCQLVKEGEYSEAKFYIRMFQTDGKGELRFDDGTVFLPNDLYPLDRDIFRLYYTSHCTDQQVVSVFIQDSFGQVIERIFSFQHDSSQ